MSSSGENIKIHDQVPGHPLTRSNLRVIMVVYLVVVVVVVVVMVLG